MIQENKETVKTQIKYQYENLVIGGSLDAVYFAFTNGYPIIFKILEKPFEKELTKENDNKRALMEFLLFILSLAGLVPFGDSISNIKIEGKEKIIVFGKNPWTFEIQTKKIYNFIKNQNENDLLKVVDWLNVMKLQNHSVKFLKIEEKDSFVKEIYFYVSKRLNRYKYFGDQVSCKGKKKIESILMKPF